MSANCQMFNVSNVCTALKYIRKAQWRKETILKLTSKKCLLDFQPLLLVLYIYIWNFLVTHFRWQCNITSFISIYLFIFAMLKLVHCYICIYCHMLHIRDIYLCRDNNNNKRVSHSVSRRSQDFLSVFLLSVLQVYVPVCSTEARGISKITFGDTTLLNLYPGLT